MVLVSGSSDFPSEQEAGDFFDLAAMTPVSPWVDLFAGIPQFAAIGSNRKTALMVGYSRVSFDVRASATEFDTIEDLGEVPMAFIQKRDVLSGYVMMGSVLGASLQYENDFVLHGNVTIDFTKAKAMRDLAI